MPTLTDTKQRLILDFCKVKDQACCRQRCLARLRADPTYLQNVVQWRHAWGLTGQTDRRNAVMNFMTSLTSVQSTKTADSTSLTSVQSTKMAANDHDVVMVKKGGSHNLIFPSGARLRLDYYPLLGKQLCRKAFRLLTTVDPWRAKRAISQGKCVLLRKKYTRSRKRHDEMLGVIHSVAQDLHLQSPLRARQ